MSSSSLLSSLTFRNGKTLALNKISGQFNQEKLADVLADIHESGEDFGLTGFSGSEIDTLLDDAEISGFDDILNDMESEAQGVVIGDTREADGVEVIVGEFKFVWKVSSIKN